MPSGGIRTSLNDMVAAITARFRERPKATPAAPDLTQFKDTFQPESGLFAPNYPLQPTDPARLRAFDYPVSFNTNFTPRSYEANSFAQLRGLADNHDITRLAIETRKDQIEGLDWTISPIDNKRINADAEGRADKLTIFWRKPDGHHPFGTWLRLALEDLLVIDAPAFEVRRNRGGEIIALDILDGATIKVLLDETGRRPLPPAPAYEQIIHGRPWVLAENGAYVEAERSAVPLFDSQIIYLPRNPRPQKVYGFSPVEQIVMTVNTALRRQHQQLQYFTEGNVPLGLVNAPEGWTPEQIAGYQQWFDSILAGNTANRTKLIWTPFGAKYFPFLENPYKDKFDEWLTRVICFAFALPPNAFVERVNRATAQVNKEAALEEGLGPLMSWVKRLVDGVIQDRMGHTDLEFSWTPPPELDPEAQTTTLDIQVKDGLRTINEARDELGLDPVEGGDEPMIWTTQGPVLLKNFTNPPTTAVPGEAAGAGGAPGTAPPEGGAAPTG